VLLVGAGGEVVYFLLNPDGSLKSFGYVYPGGLARPTYWSVRGFTDIDRDGTADIVWHGNSGETYYWLLNTNGTFRLGGYIGSVLASPTYWNIRGVGNSGR
jgi:hypothetical protein